jgi:aminopeptidase
MMRGAARLLRLRGTKAGSRDPCLRTLTREMSTFVVLPIDPTSQPGSSPLTSVDPVELWRTTPTGSKAAKVGTTRLFYNTPLCQPGKTDATAVVSLGEGFDKKDDNARRELVRKAIGSSIKQIRELGDGKKDVVVEASKDAHAAGLLTSGFACRHGTHLATAVAAHLAKYKFTLKTSPPSPYTLGEGQVVPQDFSFRPLEDSQDWETGVVYANAQNLARTVPSISSRPKADH